MRKIVRGLEYLRRFILKRIVIKHGHLESSLHVILYTGSGKAVMFKSLECGI